MGASWEGLVLEELVRLVPERDIYFYSTYSGAELDFVVRASTGLVGVEAKRSEAPDLTKSMRVSLDDLRLKHLLVVYPGAETFKMHQKVTAVPMADLAMRLSALRVGR